MQMRKAAQLQKEWGDRDCDHPGFDKEQFGGTNTGDYVCTQCGRSFPPESVRKIKASKSNFKPEG